MENFEKVELIREKTGVSYEDAKAVLEENNYDMLDAIIQLEKDGKVKEPKSSSYTAGASQEMENVHQFEKAQEKYQEDCKKNSFKEGCQNFGHFVENIFKKTVEIEFCVSRNGEPVAKFPTLILICLLLFLFWVTVPLIIIGLFFGFTYSFIGAEKVVVDVNDVCDKASEAAENIKNEFMKDDENR
ncbi:MAG: UBA/TS-N domain protein [Pseudobutyrivibrio sp.]|nr:UBA/TS-N domain protein [Pseudobutyrivibrio sp.]